ncbi:lymphocyte-specific helicase-like isoform X1 [Patiria miniata]|uniref:Proliferation-associated SNF2-like protein n=1 Tax=Patiria miniata TaxID=46514 RepID=A0A914BEV9_PATMI|nr:lymphocyte-specific helicase-like isoform X1 [Patiria miniata]
MAASVFPLGTDVSPYKPTEEPDGPHEVAHQLTNKDTTKLGLPSNDPEMAATGSEGAGPSSAPDSPSCSTADTDPGSDLGCVPLDGMITENMLNIEKELHLQSIKEEKRLKEESISVWQKEQDEQRYKRLQHLLEKSSIYSNFLLSKMEEQQKKEKLRQEKRAKKLKKKQDEEERKRAEAEEKEAKKDAEKENKGSKEAGPATRRKSRYRKQESSSPEVAGTSESQEQDRNMSTDSAKSSPRIIDQASSGNAFPSHFSQTEQRNSPQDSKSPMASPRRHAPTDKSGTSSPKTDHMKDSPSPRKDQVELERNCRTRHSSRIAKTGGENRIAKTVKEENRMAKTCDDENGIAKTVEGENRMSKTVKEENSMAKTVTEENRIAKTVEREIRMVKTVKENRRAKIVKEENSVAKTVEEESRMAKTVEGEDSYSMAKSVEGENSMAKTVKEEDSMADTVEGENRMAKTVKEEDSMADTVEGENRMAKTVGEDSYSMAKAVEGENSMAKTVKEEDSMANTAEGENRIAKTVEGENRMAKTVEEENRMETTVEGESTVPELTDAQSPDSNSTSPIGTSRGRSRKRMREDYSIADYIDKSTLTSKKLKSDAAETGSSGKQEKTNLPPRVKNENTQENQTEASQEGGSADEETKPEATSPVAAKQTEEFVDSFSRTINGEQISDLQPDLFTGGCLRKYQVEGIEWLKVLYENGVNGILGDEMGLGKTVQCIGLFAHIIKMGVPGPFLVVAPLSTLSNWMSEFKRFTPLIKVILYHGTPEERETLRHQIRKPFGEYKTLPVVVTSYEIVMIDRKHLSGHLWKYIIVDEGHRIKNLNCRLIRELKMYHSANRVLLTGTPLQNNLAELWSMLNFLLPEVFDDLKTFESWFDFSTLTKQGGDEAIVAKEREQHIVSMLHQILSPFLLRRLKSDVELKIPPKKEILVQAPMTAKQAELYRDLVDKTILAKMKERYIQPETETQEVSAGGRVRRKCRVEVDYALMGDQGENEKKEDDDIDGWVQRLSEQAERCQQANKKDPKAETKNVELNIKDKNVMSQLRKACNHPYLLEYPLDPVTQEYRIDEELVTNSGKLMVLERLLPALKKENHKVLIFSQMTLMLDVLEDYCYLRKYRYCRLDGKMKLTDRQEQIDEFNKDPDTFLFLLSTRAGGLGINLTAADTVIIYDSDWNPQSDLQAQDRCHRIGQTKPVVIYRLVTSNTIDQKIVERAAAKRKLEKMVIHQGKFKGGKSNLAKDSRSLINPAELLELLRSTDHSGFIRNCNQKVISDTDLKLLLDRSDLLARFKGQEKTGAAATKAGGKKGGKQNPRSSIFKVLDDATEDDGTELRIGT